jgi:signal peptidase I
MHDAFTLPVPAARTPGRAARCTARSARNWACFSFLLSVSVAVLMGCSLEFARVDGQSMAPTLANHDRLVVDKLAYRFGKPTPGDIVMFHAPRTPEQVFVKRIVAEAGDVVRILDGRVFVNDRVLDDSQVPTHFRSHEDWGPYRVPDDFYLVLGDHRNRSSDSRHWGPVAREAIIGKVHARWWPLANASFF